ncbi:type IV secretion system protein [Acinetobacter sp. Leaf130]|uniref:type IV secretion system protein n=1 Tax=Acinetobacter sp. Leaf130 TaxID=1736269 RepID=UPI0006FDC638|nr:type IV secretion system protein [Acinetobacter sp. Leaf130]KQQ65475.1 conjugal transfer protein TrbL [Acinetobacter sp. Leaf130]
MKKFIYIFLIFFSFLGISSAYAVDNFTPPQDLGTGGQVPPTSNSGGNNQISDEVSQVTENGMKELDKVVDSLMQGVDSNIKNNLQNYYTKITTPIMPVFAGFIVVWLAWQGFNMMLGRAIAFDDVIATFIIMLIIWSIVFSWDSFYPYIAEFFLDDIPNLISEMTGTDSKTTLQSFVRIIFDAITLAFSNVDTGITNVVSGFFFVLIYSFIFGLACLVCGLFFLIWIICKVIIGILIAVAPIFIAAAMFPATRRFATNWLHAALTPHVVILLLIVSCDLVLTSVVAGIQHLNENGSSFVGAFVMVIVLFVVIGLFLLIPKIAISLVGAGFEASTSATQGVTGSATNFVKRMMRK